MLRSTQKMKCPITGSERLGWTPEAHNSCTIDCARIARAMWASVLAICLEIPDVLAQECGSARDQKVGLVAAGAATNGEGGFTTLYGAQAVSTFERGGSTYAIVAAAPIDEN